MRIASFNINDINRRLPNLLQWLRETELDVVCTNMGSTQPALARTDPAHGLLG
jgi:exonuclease III